MNNSTTIGVIIGRFQVSELHEGHIHLIEEVSKVHSSVMIFLGTSEAINTRRNPLDFITRQMMIKQLFPESKFIVLPLADNRSNEKWSLSIDTKIKEFFPNKHAVLYGSRDSFLNSYSGKFEKMVIGSIPAISGTESRKNSASFALDSADFRDGIIYSVYSQYPTVFSVVDVIIRRGDNILLGKKSSDDKWRLIGGFCDILDASIENTVKREVYEETKLDVTNLRYISSAKINDWRYRNDTEHISVMTHLYEVESPFGMEIASDDIEQVKWFNAGYFSKNFNNLLVPFHITLFQSYLDLQPK